MVQHKSIEEKALRLFLSFYDIEEWFGADFFTVHFLNNGAFFPLLINWELNDSAISCFYKRSRKIKLCLLTISISHQNDVLKTTLFHHNSQA